MDLLDFITDTPTVAYAHTPHGRQPVVFPNAPDADSFMHQSPNDRTPAAARALGATVINPLRIALAYPNARFDLISAIHQCRDGQALLDLVATTTEFLAATHAMSTYSPEYKRLHRAYTKTVRTTLGVRTR